MPYATVTARHSRAATILCSALDCNSRSKCVAQSKLKCAQTAGAEELAGRAERLIELG